MYYADLQTKITATRNFLYFKQLNPKYIKQETGVEPLLQKSLLFIVTVIVMKY